MAEIRTTRFHGMRPALHNTIQPASSQGAAFASSARNTRLLDGSLAAMRGDVLVQTLPFSAKTIEKLPSFTCCAGLYALPYCTSVVDAPPAPCCPCENHVIVFGGECCTDGSTAHKRCDPCSGECWPLVLQAPTLPPSVRVDPATDMVSCGSEPATACVPKTCGSTGTTGDPADCNVSHGQGKDSTAYIYTWVDAFGVESPPSPPSANITKFDDQSVTVGNIGRLAPSNAVATRIYRAVWDYAPDRTNPQVQNASYQLVAELTLPVAGNQIVDDLRLCDIPGGTLMTLEDAPPPPCMEQVVRLESGYYVGFSCNELLVSERGEPWNWPTKYRNTLPDKIVALAALGDMLFVGTVGSPYRVRLTPQYGGINDGLPTQERVQGFDTQIDIQSFNEALPCVGRRTMVTTTFGAMYATRRGLVALQAQGPATLISKDRIGTERWREWAPNQAAWFEGHYIGLRAPTGKGFIMEVPRDGRSMEFGDFVEVDLDVSLLRAGRDGRLYGVRGNDIVALFEANTLRPYRWRSRTFRTAALSQMGAAKVVAEYGPPIEFTVYVGGRKVYTRQVRDGQPFRLPKHPRGLDFVVEITGTTTVTEMHIGPNLRALATNATSAGSGQGTGDG